MKDGVARKLGRPTAHRWAMLRTMVSQLITHERMETTVAKARGRRRRAANGRRHEAQAAAASTRAFSKHPRRWLCDAHPAAQAKEVRRIADHMVSLGKDGSLAARRRAAAVVRGQDVLRKLFSELSSRYAARVGGYTRVLPTRRRVGDGAPMAFCEFVGRAGELRPAATPTPAAAADAAWAADRRRVWTRGGLRSAAANAALVQPVVRGGGGAAEGGASAAAAATRPG